jgi:hypothetical protein
LNEGGEPGAPSEGVLAAVTVVTPEVCTEPKVSETVVLAPPGSVTAGLTATPEPLGVETCPGSRLSSVPNRPFSGERIGRPKDNVPRIIGEGSRRPRPIQIGAQLAHVGISLIILEGAGISCYPVHESSRVLPVAEGQTVGEVEQLFDVRSAIGRMHFVHPRDHGTGEGTFENDRAVRKQTMLGDVCERKPYAARNRCQGRDCFTDGACRVSHIERRKGIAELLRASRILNTDSPLRARHYRQS